jgi:hypothetical protein
MYGNLLSFISSSEKSIDFFGHDGPQTTSYRPTKNEANDCASIHSYIRELLGGDKRLLVPALSPRPTSLKK